MLYIRPSDKSVQYVNRAGKPVFTDTGYQRLFDFVEADVSDVAGLVADYFATRVNPITLDVLDNEKEADKLYTKLKKRLKQLHPFFELNDGYSIIPQMLGHHLNDALIYKGMHDGSDTMTVMDADSYNAVLRHLVEPSLNESYLASMKCGIPNTKLAIDAFSRKLYLDYTSRRASGSSKASPDGVSCVAMTQTIIRAYMYWIVDASAERFKKMSTEERCRLFRQVFGKDDALPDIRLTLNFRWGQKIDGNATEEKSQALWGTTQYLVETLLSGNGTADSIEKNADKIMEEAAERDERSEYRRAFTQLLSDDDELDEDMTARLAFEIKTAKKSKAPALQTEYEANDLFSLLFIEVVQMIQQHLIVKRCRNCRRYFITDRLNNDYCSRIADGETEPCIAIGSDRVFFRTMQADYPLKIYNRTYKTVYARMRRGNMTRNEFDAWRDVAKGKLEDVRSGKMSVEVYEEWLGEQ